MKRQIIEIDRDKCNGCGVCVPNCHEGALQIIDEKAVMISDLMCDGLGACVGHCPVGAITVIEREAQPYDEILTISKIVENGKNTTIAHLKHLKDHGEFGFLKQGVTYLRENAANISFDVNEVISIVHNHGGSHQNTPKPNPKEMKPVMHQHGGGGCPGSAAQSFAPKHQSTEQVANNGPQASELSQWPIQMHLINPVAGYFQNADFLLASDCSAFALGGFHGEYLKGKKLGIACPKLDHNMEVYVEKLIRLIDESKINTITVIVMEVPCCNGLLQMTKMAVQQAKRKVPVKAIVVGIQGDILAEEWV
jgi:NAD-dependent dihydropyrimidine dehydrogenase PreA subunit